MCAAAGEAHMPGEGTATPVPLGAFQGPRVACGALQGESSNLSQISSETHSNTESGPRRKIKHIWIFQMRDKKVILYKNS